jgi:hypothetical protein
MPIDAVQYNTRQPVARIFHMRARMNLLPVLARDIYANGHGHMRAKIAHLVTVADGKGPEFDQGELVTWVNDCVLFAPSMLLAVSTTWSHVDARTFDLAFTDRGNTVTARVFIDERGAPINFESRDRYLNDPADPKHPLIRAPWTTPIEGWQRIYEHMVPARGRATWHLADSDFTYAEFDLDPASVAFDELPASAIGVRAA